MTWIRRGMGATGAAMIAVLLLSYAFVQSTVMQAAPPSPAPAMPICGMDHMAGMAMAAASVDDGAGKSPGHATRHPVCPFCAAAANPPLGAAPILAPVPSTLVLVAFLPLASHGARGPPAREPRARGPPSISVTV